jgi:hypothetical protein
MSPAVVDRLTGRTWPSPAADPADQGGLVLLRPPRRGRIHLGCGDIRLDGYLNIDLPPERGVASGTSRPDLESDVMAVRSPASSLDEIRLHHLFEHFDRAHTLALLIRWHGWLRPGGSLTIETPDFDACIAGFEKRSFADRSLILRHVFGSQEAPWAQHLDGWSPSRFREVLSRLGFVSIGTEPTYSDERKLLVNVIARARRAPDGGPDTLKQAEAARAILRLSMNGENPTEERLYERWRRAFDELLEQP